MATPWPENPSTSRERVIKELIQGQEIATHLQFLLKKPYGDDGFHSANELVVKILRSFTEALSLLTSCDFAEILQNQTTSQVDSVGCDDRRSEDSGESRKRPTTKDSRGSHKRKKISQSCTIVSPTTEDGLAWRKYGQKEILNAKFPRSYFRCTRKYDQGCKATKQVQRMEEDPQMFRTIYIGHHTCRDILKVPQIITEPDSDMLQHKQEYKEEAPLSDLTDNFSSLDPIMWKDLVSFEPSDEPAAADHYRTAADSITMCTEGSCQSYDMDLVVKAIDFDSDFQFDESDFNYLS